MNSNLARDVRPAPERRLRPLRGDDPPGTDRYGQAARPPQGRSRRRPRVEAGTERGGRTRLRRVGQGELASLGTGGQQSPGPGRAGGGKDRVHTAVTVAGLGHAAQALDGALGKVAAQQHLHDGAVRDVGVGGRCAASGQGGGEGAGVGQTAGTDGELAAQRLEAGAHPAGGGAARAEHGMRDAAPRAAVAVRVGDAAAQVPAARFGDVGGGQFGRVQGDGPLVGARVEVDAVAALAATAVLAGAQQVAGTGGGHPQGAGAVGDAGAAVPVSAGRGGSGAPGRDRARRHAGASSVSVGMSHGQLNERWAKPVPVQPTASPVVSPHRTLGGCLGLRRSRAGVRRRSTAGRRSRPVPCRGHRLSAPP